MTQLDPKDAHKVFMAFCIKHPETLRLFDIMREKFAEIFPYLEVISSTEECTETVTGDTSIEEWKKSADKICDTLELIINPDDCKRLNDYMYRVLNLPNAFSHFKPRVSTEKEYFNRKSFAKCINLAVDEFDLFDGRSCCNRPMSKRSLGKIAYGYDIVDEEQCDCRRVFTDDTSSEDSCIGLFTHPGKKDAWSQCLLTLAHEVFAR